MTDVTDVTNVTDRQQCERILKLIIMYDKQHPTPAMPYVNYILNLRSNALLPLSLDNIIRNQALGVLLDTLEGTPKRTFANSSMQRHTKLDSIHANTRIRRLQASTSFNSKAFQLAPRGYKFGSLIEHLLEDVEAHAECTTPLDRRIGNIVQMTRQNDNNLRLVANSDEFVSQQLQATNHMSAGVVPGASLKKGFETLGDVRLEVLAFLFEEKLDGCEDLGFDILSFVGGDVGEGTLEVVEEAEEECFEFLIGEDRLRVADEGLHLAETVDFEDHGLDLSDAAVEEAGVLACLFRGRGFLGNRRLGGGLGEARGVFVDGFVFEDGG